MASTIVKATIFDASTGTFRYPRTGEVLDIPAAKANVFNVVNTEATAITIGQPVYAGATGVKLAKSDTLATTKAVGLVFDTSIEAAGTGGIVTDGILTATTAQWDALTGDTGGLTPGAYYYVSDATAGRLTKTVVSTAGSYITKVGIAITATDLDVGFEIPFGI